MTLPELIVSNRLAESASTILSFLACFTGKTGELTLYTLQCPKVHIIFHKAIRIYMGGLILGVNTLYRVVCFLKLFIIGGKGLRNGCLINAE